MTALVAVSLAMVLGAEPNPPAPTAELVARLVEIIVDPQANSNSRREALRALEKLGPEAKPAVDPLVRQFGRIRWGEQLALQEAMIHALGKIGPAARKAVPTLTRLIGQDLDTDRAVKAAIDQIMIPAERAELQELTKELQRPDAAQRLRAVKALGAMGAKAESAVPDLLNMLRDSDADIRRLTIAALKAIQPNLKPGAEIVGAYVLDLQDNDDAVRLLAARALGRIGPPAAAAIPALQKLQNDPIPDVRAAAGDAITRIGAQ